MPRRRARLSRLDANWRFADEKYHRQNSGHGTWHSPLRHSLRHCASSELRRRGRWSSGTGTMLELGRVLCSRKGKLNNWIVFFDGEEAQGQWADKNSIRWTATNSTLGSREMAASMALSGELKQVTAMILADMIGPSNLRIKRDTGSTRWLVDLIWATATRLGYAKVFVNENYPVGGDDHFSFIRRGIAACDIIDFDVQTTYWHTPQDTLEKVDPRSLAIVGHVFLETVPKLEKKIPVGQ